ncbi:hypothetical protein BC829DRAFT_179748 [Chytridium lagenaria]|nr:hypothetical protein BC829DRAFT_179748 [Chytridium lagenaria]
MFESDDESDEEEMGGLRLASSSSLLLGAVATLPLPPAHLKPEGPDSYISTTFPVSQDASPSSGLQRQGSGTNLAGLQRTSSGVNLQRAGSGSNLSSLMQAKVPIPVGAVSKANDISTSSGLRRTASGVGISTSVTVAADEKEMWSMGLWIG